MRHDQPKLLTSTGAVKHYRNGRMIYVSSVRRKFVPCTTRQEAKHLCQWAETIKKVQGGFWCSKVENANSARADKRGHWPEGKRRSDLTAAQVAEVVTLVERALRSGMSLREIQRRTAVDESRLRRWLKGDHWPTSETAKLVHRGLRKLPNKMHCRRGHELTEENVYRAPGSPDKRHCRQCRKERRQERHQVNQGAKQS